MRLIFKYAIFSGILLLSVSQIACPDLRVAASLAAKKARDDKAEEEKKARKAAEEEERRKMLQPPANVTNHVLQRNPNGITLTWINPTDADFSKVLILRSTSSISHAPATGQDYTGVTLIGSSRMMYNAASSSFTDTEITEGVTYFYKIFSYDTSFNYASGVELEGDTTSPKNVINSGFVNLDSNGITLAWTNPTNADFSKVLILRSASSIVDTPTIGHNYTDGDSIGSSTVVYSSNATTFIDRDVGTTVASTHYYYKLFAYDASFNYASGVEISGGGSKADHDGDGLIEIYTAEMLNNMRYDLAGESYKSSTTQVTGNVDGCPNNMCNGYELTAHIDLLNLLDTNGNGHIDTKDETVGGKTHEVIDVGAGAGQDTSWMPVGNVSAPFTGTFEGNNHTIANLWVNVSSSGTTFAYAGLFGVIGGTSVEIRNVGVISGSIHAFSSAANSHAGSLVGHFSGSSLTITNCNFSGSGGVSSSSGISGDTGGLVGHSTAGSSLTITKCTFSGVSGVSATYNSASSTGGLVGISNGSLTITNCSFFKSRGVSASNIVGSGSGGLVGSSFHGSLTITNCTFSGFGGVSGAATSGGLVGLAGDTLMITSCSFSGSGGVSSTSASGTTNSGGLVGSSTASMTITNCTFSGSGGVSSTSTGTAVSYSGGLVGYSTASLTITNCTFSGDAGVSSTSASAESDAGGLVGRSENILTITNCTFSGSSGVVSNASTNTNASYSRSGGLVGVSHLSAASLTITKSSFSGSGGVSSVSTNADPHYSYSGGLVGLSTDSSFLKITKCTVSGLGRISSSGSSGGLVGIYQTDSTITNSYFSGSGDISAFSHSGGLVGTSYGTSSYLAITNSYFSGSGDISTSSSSASSSGGLVGKSENILAITNSYFSGSADISASSHSGGLVGLAESNSTLTITNSYFGGSAEISASSNSGGLVGSSAGSLMMTNSYWNTNAPQNVGGMPQSPKRAQGDATTEPSGTTGLTLMQLQATSARFPSGLLLPTPGVGDAWDLGTNMQLPAVKLCVNATTTNHVTTCASYDDLLVGQR